MKAVKRERYSSDDKDRAVAMVSLGRPVPEVAQELGIGPSILYRWTQSQRQGTQNAPAQLGGVVQRAAGELDEAAELRRLQGERPAAFGERHFKKSRCDPRHSPPEQTRTMIQQLHSQTQASIRQICHVLKLPRSSFYHAAEPSATQLEDIRLGALIEEIFKRNRRRYGYRRILQELKDHDIACAPARLRRLMRQRGLRAIQPKNYLPKTSDGRADRPCANLLARQAMPTKPNEAWAGDITFIPTTTRWLYLAVVIDLGSRRIIGWSLDTHMRAELVVDALQQALQTRPQARRQHTLFHSDRGSQYGSSAFRAVLAGAGMRQSMSAKANPYDNAWTESFMGTLKREMLQGGCFEDATDARLELFDHIDAYYNNQRKHSAIGYLTPNQFEAQHINLN